MKIIEKCYDVVVVGGGMSGVCAAISAARHNAKTVLIHNRPVLGGNASSEIKVSINGAGRHDGFCNAMESGVILELLLKNKKVNPQYSFSVMDHVSWNMVKSQENLDLYLNTQMISAKTQDSVITSIDALQISTNTLYKFKAKQFIDTTGDANLAYEAGADYTIGREGKDVYGESLAPDQSDEYTMGSTILYQARHTGKPIMFKRPDWAYEITEQMLGGRQIHELEDGYWWVEIGGDDLKIIENAEDVRDELLKYVYGVFDYIKNSGKFPEAYDLVLDWIAPIPGKRESRRVYGDYVLNQNDCYEGARFKDAVAYGGWTMDNHTVGGIRAPIGTDSQSEEGTVWNEIKDIYTIPYRCLYSRNIKNLYIGGRCISVSHMALSSTRVIATCSVIGQAVGTAAAMAVKYNIYARDILEHIEELQQTLIRDDAYIPGIKTKDDKNLINKNQCIFTASSCIPGGEPQNINGDYARRVGKRENAWISGQMQEGGEWIEIQFPKAVQISSLLLRFDPNFSQLLTPTIDLTCRKNMVPDMPLELVKDYKIELFHNAELVEQIMVTENFLRVNQHLLKEKMTANRIRVTVYANYGDPHVRIHEIRAYE